jgi:hypothetical protein
MGKRDPRETDRGLAIAGGQEKGCIEELPREVRDRVSGAALGAEREMMRIGGRRLTSDCLYWNVILLCGGSLSKYIFCGMANR